MGRAKLTITRRTLPTVMFRVPVCMGTGLSLSYCGSHPRKPFDCICYPSYPISVKHASPEAVEDGKTRIPRGISGNAGKGEGISR